MLLLIHFCWFSNKIITLYIFTASFPFQQPTPSTFQVWRSGQVYKYNWKWSNIFMKLDNIYVVACCLRAQRDILWCTGEVAVGDIVMTMVQICSNWAARWQAAVTWQDVQYTVNTGYNTFSRYKICFCQ